MTTFLQDLRFALRSFLRAPGFTVTALLTVALGVGANSAIFSVVYGVLFRPLPFGEPERIALIGHTYRQLNLQTGVSGVGYRFYRDQNRAFDRTAGFANWEANLAGDGEPERLVGQRIAGDYFGALGLQPIVGRGFLPEEEVEGRDRVVILSEALWDRDFARDRGVVGKPLLVNGENHTIVGVMPNGFQFGRDPIVIWKPLVLTPVQADPRCWGCEFMSMIGRLKPGVTLAAAGSDLDRLAALVRQNGDAGRDADWGLYARSAQEQITGNVRPALLVLMGAVAFVLLIASANLANLLLARATSRQREIAIRTALGAGRGRLARQLLTESVVLAVAGGILGLGLAWAAIRGLVASNPVNLPRIAEVGLHPAVLLFTGGITVGLGLLFGLVPALHAARPALHGTLKDGTRSSHGGGTLRASLVVSEVALAIVLLVGAGLMLKSFRKWVAVDPGFRAERLLTFRVSLSAAKYPAPAQQAAFFEQLRERLAVLPGVEAVGGNVALPMTNSNWTRSFSVEGFQPPPNSNGPWGDFRVVTPGYFETMGIPIHRGRSFDATDRAGSRSVAVVDEVLASRYWSGEDPLGKRVGLRTEQGVSWFEVIGVVGHVMQNNPRDDAHTQLYLSLAQFPQAQLGVVLRTRGDPAALEAAVRRAVLEQDPQQPVFAVQPMTALLAGSSALPRFLSLLLGLFAAVAATLAAVGIYGVMSYSVAQRTRELGIRLALGAESATVLRLVLHQGLTLAAIGIGLGVAGAFGLGRVLSTQLFQTRASDPVVFVAVTLGLVVVALAATLIPARRATRVDPIVALRAE